MRKFSGSKGSVSRLTIESPVLKSNMLGDPSVRLVDVYIPAGHDGQGLPLLVDLVGFTGSGLSHTNWVGFRENLPERLDRLIGEQRARSARHPTLARQAIRAGASIQPRPTSRRGEIPIERGSHGAPTSRDFVPWRFSDAGRRCASRARHCRRPKTCTN
jgi:hypothetical protein